MQIDIVYLGKNESPQDPKWVLLQLGCNESGVIHHSAGATVKTTDTELTVDAVGEAETRARYLGLFKFYVEGA